MMLGMQINGDIIRADFNAQQLEQIVSLVTHSLENGVNIDKGLYGNIVYFVYKYGKDYTKDGSRKL